MSQPMEEDSVPLGIIEKILSLNNEESTGYYVLNDVFRYVEDEDMVEPVLAPLDDNTAQSVGNAFVKWYYNSLSHSPELVYKFYQDSSVSSRADSNGVITSATTQGIHEKILSLDYKDSTAEIKTVDAQQSLGGGVVVHATGYITGSNSVRKKFAQTFFLAPQKEHYYVLNDVFRYIEDEDMALAPVDDNTEDVQPVLQTRELGTPPAQIVGNAFVEQYYSILHQSPELVYKLYQDSSVLSHPDSNGVITSATTPQGIHEKILSLNYKDSTSEIKTADAQQSLGDGVVVHVTGYMTGRDSVRKKFAQTLFLAPQEKQYVLNDDVRYDEDEDMAEPVDDNTENVQAVLQTRELEHPSHLVNLPEQGHGLSNQEDPPLPHLDQSENVTIASVPPTSQDDGPKKSYASIKSKHDMFWKLTDDVLIEILSHLPMKEVVVTSILSKRWKGLWKLVSTIDFSDLVDKFQVGMLGLVSYKAEQFVTDILKQSLVSVWKRLIINAEFVSDEAISELQKREVVELYLKVNACMDFASNYPLPSRILDLSTLVKLDLYGFGIRKTSNFGDHPTIKYLKFESITFDDAKFISSFLHACPNLCELVLNCCRWKSWEICIDSNLHKLCLEILNLCANADTIGELMITLATPKLKLLRVCDSIGDFRCVEFKEITEVVIIELDGNPHGTRAKLKKLLKHCSNMKRFTLKYADAFAIVMELQCQSLMELRFQVKGEMRALVLQVPSLKYCLFNIMKEHFPLLNKLVLLLVEEDDEDEEDEELSCCFPLLLCC